MKKYLPSLEMITTNTLATLAALVISAWVINQVPALKKIVNSYKEEKK